MFGSPRILAGALLASASFGGVAFGLPSASPLATPSASSAPKSILSAPLPVLDERAVFLSPFLPAAKPSRALPQGALELDFLPELLDMIPANGVFDVVQFPLPDGTFHDIWLTEFKVTNEATTIVVMQPSDTEGGEPLANHGFEPTVRLFRGHVTGAEQSLVYLAFSAESISGFISINGRVYSISNGPRGDHPIVVSDLAGLPEGAINWYEYACEVRDGGKPPEPTDGGVAALGTCKVLEMAFETDNEFRALFGSDQAAINYATQIAAGMNTIYLADQNLFPVMSFLRVWSPGVNDPWSAASSGAQLDQFVGAWAGGGGPAGSTPRDLAHLISARDLGGGVAYLNAVCNPAIGFAVSGNLSGFFPFPLQDNSAQNWDIMVTTHEMGHNAGCNHTHDLGVDNCVSGGCIPNGTIMSYCHLCPGGLANVVLNFAPANIAQMDAFLPGLGCLSEPCPIFDPANFNASDGAFVDAVRLTWIAPAVASLGFEIERREVGGVFASLNPAVPSSATSLDDTTAVVGTTYEYRIRSIRVDGEPADWVGPDSGFKGFLGPTQLAASDGLFADRVELSWEAPFGYTPDSYSIYRATTGGSMLKLAESAQPVFSDNGTYDPAFEAGWPDTDGDMNDGPIPPTTPGVQYFYEVRANVGGGVSAPTEDEGFRATPGPSNLVASGAINGSLPPFSNRIRLTWSLPGPVNTVYIYRSAGGSNFAEVARLNGSFTRWSDVQVESDVTYSYQVQSFSNLTGLSAPSDIDLGFALMPPSVTSASDGTNSDVTVTWSAPATWTPGAYNVWRKRSGRAPWPAQPIATNLPANQFSFVDETAEPGAVYVYAVAGRSNQFNSYSDRGATNTGYPTVLPPINVSASDGGFPGFIEITWTPVGTTTNVTWEIWRRVSGSNAAYVRLKTITQNFFLDSTTSPGVVYDYYIRTKASNGAVSVPSAVDTGFR
jgi:hypothetical protein